jgi:hypothetical protein
MPLPAAERKRGQGRAAPVKAALGSTTLTAETGGSGSKTGRRALDEAAGKGSGRETGIAGGTVKWIGTEGVVGSTEIGTEMEIEIGMRGIIETGLGIGTETERGMGRVKGTAAAAGAAAAAAAGAAPSRETDGPRAVAESGQAVGSGAVAVVVIGMLLPPYGGRQRRTGR